MGVAKRKTEVHLDKLSKHNLLGAVWVLIDNLPQHSTMWGYWDGTIHVEIDDIQDDSIRALVLDQDLGRSSAARRNYESYVEFIVDGFEREGFRVAADLDEILRGWVALRVWIDGSDGQQAQ